MTNSMDELVDAYVKLRDKKARIQKRHKEEIAPTNELIDKIGTALLMALNGIDAEMARTDHGTAYKTTRTNVKIEDWDTTLPWVISNNLEHMLERRLSKSAVEEYIEASGDTPPGVSITRDLTIGVRRK